MRPALGSFAIILTSVLAAGCAGSTSGGSGLPEASNPNGGPHRSHAKPGASNYLYVTDPKVNSLKILDPSYNIVKTITSGLSGPVGDWVDGNGNIYVANENNCSGGNVVEYAHGSSSPTFTYSSGLICPLYVAVDGAGNVFVFD